MPRNQNCEDMIFNKLDSLREKYEKAERLCKSFQDQMGKCLEELDWQDDIDLILNVVCHLPQCYLRFRIYERFYELKNAENNKSSDPIKTASSKEGGDGYA